MAQGLFFGGTGRRAVAHTRPEFPKMPTAPSAFPLLGAPQAPGDKPNLPEGSKSLGGRPPEAVGKSPGTETHSARTASRQLGRPKCYPAPGDVQSEINLSPKWSTRFDTAAFIATLCHNAMWSMLDDLAYYYYIIVGNFILIRLCDFKYYLFCPFVEDCP